MADRIWTDQDVAGLLTRFYNRSDEEAAEVVGRWELPRRPLPRVTQTERVLTEPAGDNTYRRAQVFATLAVAEELATWRTEIMPRVALWLDRVLPAVMEGQRDMLLDALGDGSHLDMLVRVARDLESAVREAEASR